MKYYEKEIEKLLNHYKILYNSQINIDPGFKNYKKVSSNLYNEFLNKYSIFSRNSKKEWSSSIIELIDKLKINNTNEENILPSPLNFDLNIYEIIKKELNIEIFSNNLLNDYGNEQLENRNSDLDETLDRYYKRSSNNVEYKKEDVKKQINTITHSTLKNKSNMGIEIEENLDTLLLFNEEEYEIIRNSKKAYYLEKYLRLKSIPENERTQKPLKYLMIKLLLQSKIRKKIVEHNTDFYKKTENIQQEQLDKSKQKTNISNNIEKYEEDNGMEI
jgi:hypothetical protein